MSILSKSGVIDQNKYCPSVDKFLVWFVNCHLLSHQSGSKTFIGNETNNSFTKGLAVHVLLGLEFQMYDAVRCL